MKKLTCLTLLTVYLFSANVIAKEIVVGAPMAFFADKWLTYLYDSIRQYDEENAGITFKLTDANNDATKMLSEVESFIEQQVDALLVVPTDPNIVKVISVKAEKAGIPLIIANRTPFEKDLANINGFVGPDDMQAGEMQGDFILQQLNGKPAKVAILLGELGHSSQIKRTEGLLSKLKDQPNIEILIQQSANYERAKALDLATNILSENKEINVIVSNNDEMAIGAIIAVNKLGLKDEDLLIVGVDGTLNGLNYLGQGLDMTAFQSASAQGYRAAQMTHQIIKGEPIEKVISVPFEVVTPDKKAEYEAKYSVK